MVFVYVNACIRIDISIFAESTLKERAMIVTKTELIAVSGSICALWPGANVDIVDVCNMSFQIASLFASVLAHVARQPFNADVVLVGKMLF